MDLSAALRSDDAEGFSLWPSASMNPVSSGVNPAWGEDQPGRGTLIWHSKGSGGGNFWSMGKAKGGGQQSAGQAGTTPSGSGPQSLTVPYQRTFSGGLQDGLSVIITGTLEQSFRVNFETKQDIAFHFNPRIDEGTIVRNSCIQKKWGNEERGGGFPFVKGQTFKMKIKCTERWFEVSIKDAPLLTFEHRVKDLKSVTKLAIGRGVKLSNVEIENPSRSFSW